MSLTSEQVEIIKSTVPVLQQYGNTITSEFYKTVLEENPSLHNVFNQANQVNNHQAKALAGSLLAYATHIDDLGALSPAVEKICQKHASLYIQPEHYDVVGEGLLRAMGTVLGDALTLDILQAWEAAYWQLAKLFIKREEQLYSEAEDWTTWRDFKISNKVKESEVVTSFYLKPADGRLLPSFLPGQYVSLMVDVPNFGYKQSRQYSLSDAPQPDFYRISVKREAGLDPNDPQAQAHPGWISNILHSSKDVGDVVQLSHPQGDFYLDPDNLSEGPIVLLSAGVGITPMISILNTLCQRDVPNHISFIHGARSTSVQAFANHVQVQALTHKNVHPVTFVRDLQSEPKCAGVQREGRLELGKLDAEKELCLDDERTRYFVCGPEGFMAHVWRELRERDVQAERIRMEVFGTGELPH